MLQLSNDRYDIDRCLKKPIFCLYKERVCYNKMELLYQERYILTS